MILVIKRRCPDTKRILRTLIDPDDIVSANEQVLHEIEGYTEDGNPIFKEDGDVSFECMVTFRNSSSMRVPDSDLLLLNKIVELRTQEFHSSSAIEEIDLGEESSTEKLSYEEHEDEDEDDDED